MTTPEQPTGAERLILSGDMDTLRNFYRLATEAGLSAVFEDTHPDLLPNQDPHDAAVSQHAFQNYTAMAGITYTESVRAWNALRPSVHRYDAAPSPWDEVIVNERLSPLRLGMALHHTFSEGRSSMDPTRLKRPHNIGPNGLNILSFFHGNTAEDTPTPEVMPSPYLTPAQAADAIAAYGAQLKLGHVDHQPLARHFVDVAATYDLDDAALEATSKTLRQGTQAIRLHPRLYFGLVEYTKAVRQARQAA